ncbi:MAG: hypothetical protein AAF502_22635 [Bacteroidota bacterium]
MKKILLVATVLFFGLGLHAQEANKKYVKTLDPQLSQFVMLEFDYPAEAIEWDQEKLRILVDVNLKNGNDKILEQLMLAGRYKISSRKEGESFIIDIPGLKKEVTIRGQKLEEEIKAVVFVPSYTTVETQTADGATQLIIQRGVDRELAERGLAAKGVFDELEMEMNFTLPEEKEPSKEELENRMNDLEDRIKALENDKKKIENTIEEMDGSDKKEDLKDETSNGKKTATSVELKTKKVQKIEDQ